MENQRDTLIKEFIDWTKKPANYLPSYKDVFNFKKLKEWDTTYFGNKIFSIKGTNPTKEISEIRRLIYDRGNKEWLTYSKKQKNEAPRAILGDNNYLKFLQEKLLNSTSLRSSNNEKIFISIFNKQFSIDQAKIDKNGGFEFSGIYVNREKMKSGSIVFFSQLGDKVSWDKGLSAICEIVKEPYDLGYEQTNHNPPQKYFKIMLKPLLILQKVLSRRSFEIFPIIRNIPFIGPKTKNEPNQANQLLTLDQTKNLVSAIAKLLPAQRIDLDAIFGAEFLDTSLDTSQVDPGISDLILPPGIEKNPMDGDAYNRIIYGAPGTGKSYKLNKEAEQKFPHPLLMSRVTFHSGYSYREFFGSYKPKPIYRTIDQAQVFTADRISLHPSQMEPMIEYVFEPGSLLTIWLRALANPSHNFLLIIEELNRANAAAVFGEIFQLLDRQGIGEEEGISEYTLTPDPSVKEYLSGLKQTFINSSELRLPNNLYLWATMNNADQGVLPLDTAFKRRWTFSYIGIDDNQGDSANELFALKFLPEGITWGAFRTRINKQLEELGIHEDKLIGPFFLSKKEMHSEEHVINKLLLYLKEDVLKYKSGFFAPSITTFSSLIKKYNHGENIFDFSF